MQTCYRHPSVDTGVSCSSCGRPICTDCMTATPVGLRCPECAKQRTKVQAGPAAFRQSEPRATYALLAINILIFFAQVITGGGGWNVTSGDVYNEGVLVGTGFYNTGEALGVAEGEWWRLITGGFLHGSPIHLLLNMIALFFLGSILEPAIGTARFVALYFASLLAGSLGALLVDPNAYTVGASGGVFGLMGATLVILRARGIDPMQSGIGPLIILNLLFTFAVPGISVGGHLGGLAGGVVAAFVILAAERRRSQVLAVAGCAVLALACAAAGVVAAGA